MSVITPEVKSRGMKFAEEQLLKQGWTQGDPHGAPSTLPQFTAHPQPRGGASSWIISTQSIQLEEDKLAEREICRRKFDIYGEGEKRKKFDNR